MALFTGVLEWKDTDSRKDGKERQVGDVALCVNDQFERMELQSGMDE